MGKKCYSPIGFFIFRAGKIVLKPEIRILVGKLLKEFGQVLSSKDRSFLEKIMKSSSIKQ